jgi:UDP-glucose 4-epimerase
MRENILVTGGAGYIGSVVAGALLKAGAEVVVLDNLSRGKRAAVPEGAEFVAGDVGDRAALDRLFRERPFAAVMHFAASMEVGESMQFPALYFRNNSSNTLALLEAVMAHKISRFVFSSTAALYGIPERSPIEETDPLRPINPYGESKFFTERMLAWFHRLHGLRYASLRYFNAAGAADGRGEDRHPETHLIPAALEAATGKREHIAIYGTDYPTPDGTCVRDYIHVSDLASAHLLALAALEKKGQLIYNLGNSRGFSVREVIESARRVTGCTIAARESERRPGDPAVLVASSKKIRDELGWVPKHPELDDIVRSAWEWRRAHPNGYEEPSQDRPASGRPLSGV